jgi:hypothetical protein
MNILILVSQIEIAVELRQIVFSIKLKPEST